MRSTKPSELLLRRKYIVVTKSVMVSLDDGAWARLDPCEHLEINVEIVFDDAAIGNQTLTYRHSDEAVAELAPVLFANFVMLNQ